MFRFGVNIFNRYLYRLTVIASGAKQSVKRKDCRAPSELAMTGIKAFTLIELLIVIAIIAILGSATVLVLNPLELMRQGRDGTRINDTENIEKAIKMTLFNNPSLIDSLPSTNIYLSLPTGSCPSNPPSGYSYVCNSTSLNITKTDGTGWIPLSLQNIASLPTDPNTSNNNFYYAFVADPLTKTYVISSLLESEKQLKNAAAKSGTGDPSRFEKGNVTLWDKANGLVGYWPMDSGTGGILAGQTISDLSGNGHDGMTYNTNGIGMSYVNGKSGTAIQFDGVDDKIDTLYSSAFDCISGVTVSAWVKTNTGSSAVIFSKYGVSGSGLSYMAVVNPPYSFYNQGWKSGSRTVTDNAWHHVVGSTNGTTYKTYFDGRLDTTGSGASINISNSTASIGGPNSNNWGQYFNGTIDEVSVWCKVLSDDEVRGMYGAQK